MEMTCRDMIGLFRSPRAGGLWATADAALPYLKRGVAGCRQGSTTAPACQLWGLLTPGLGGLSEPKPAPGWWCG
jgi:hypothetical protein